MKQILFEKTDNKMLFVYQSKYVKIIAAILETLSASLCNLQDKYLLQLYFLVVQTNVNCQAVAVIVTEEETTCMLSKTLQIIKGKFNTLDLIFSFSFLISLFSADTLFLYFHFQMILNHIFQEEEIKHWQEME